MSSPSDDTSKLTLAGSASGLPGAKNNGNNSKGQFDSIRLGGGFFFIFVLRVLKAVPNESLDCGLFCHVWLGDAPLWCLGHKGLKSRCHGRIEPSSREFHHFSGQINQAMKSRTVAAGLGVEGMASRLPSFPWGLDLPSPRMISCPPPSRCAVRKQVGP